MANRTVSLYRKCKTPEGWKRYPAVMSANGKVKTHAVLVAGVEVVYPVGHYELRRYEGRKTVWVKVEGTASDALAEMKTTQRTMTATVAAEEAGIQVVVDPSRLELIQQRKKFVSAALARGSKEAAETYGRSIAEFLDGCTKTYADQLEREDIQRFHVQMRARGLGDRTVSNQHSHLRSFLLFMGLDKASVKSISGAKPKFEKTLPEIYEPDELTTFFDLLDNDYDRVLFDVLLTTGLREREAVNLEWKDIRWSRRTLKVESKPHRNHKVKDAEEREMPLTEDVLKRLKAYRENHKDHFLVFGKGGGTEDAVDGHLLRRLKRIARKNGLNCEACETCKANKECERWFLHKFRATYITTLLRNGMDLRTVMTLSGHSDIESVMRYLRPAEGEAVQNKVNAIKWR